MGPGTVVGGRFEIERFVGEGGMGAIYRARHLETDVYVALKVLAGDIGDRERFAREAEILALLDHPHIVSYVAHGTFEGAPYLAMEWLTGEDLSARLARERLSLAESVALARAVAEALACAHGHGVIHRDMKPSNLYLPGGAPERVKVLDFGIARLLHPLGQGPRGRTGTGVVVGTLGYMAPEQARGERVVDARVDVFALGCVLFECLTGRPAFDGDSPVAILAKILADNPPDVRELREVPDALGDLVARMLEKNPDDRPRSATSVGKILAELHYLSPTRQRSVEVRTAITVSERRFVSVVLASRCAAIVADGATTVTIAADDVVEMRERVRTAVLPFGAWLDRMADGSLVMTLSEAEAATDLAAQAARCALSLLDAVPDLRVAVATGRALVGKALPVGEALDRAAALLDVTPQGVTLIDEVTRGLLDARFVVDDTAGTPRLASERQHTGVRVLLGRPVPCVGRDREIASLAATVSHAIAEPIASMVLVTGPPGIGKSRLVHELTSGLENRQEGLEIWRASGEPLRNGSPLAMLAQIVRGVCGLQAGEPSEAAQAKLIARARRFLAEDDAARVTCFLAELVGAPFPAAHAPELHAARADSRSIARAIVSAWEEFVGAEIARHALVLLLEDLHWGDAQTLRVVLDLLVRFEARPLVVIATARTEVHDLYPDLGRTGGIQEICLGELTRKASEKLVRAVLGDTVDAALAARIGERAAGNAFFLEELIRAAAEGLVESFPETVLAMVDARLKRIEPEARRVLRAASVFGERFWPRGVAALVGREGNAAGIDAEIAELDRAEIITPRGQGRLRGEAEYGFRHALLRDVAYAALAPADRALAHRLAGAWLEAEGERDAKVLAEHFERGAEGLPGIVKAIRGWLRAAQDASQRGGNAQAIAHLERGITLLERLPDGQERLREELALRGALASCVVSAKGYAASQVGALFARVNEIISQLGGDPPLLHLVGLYAYHLFREELPIAREFARRALVVAERSGDPALLVEGIRPAWNAAYFSGDLLEAAHYTDRGLALYDRDVFRKQPIGFQMDVGVNALGIGAKAQWKLGHLDRAAGRLAAGLSLAREIAQPMGIAWSLQCVAWVHDFQRDWARAEQAAAEGLAICDAHGFSAYGVVCHFLHAWAIGSQGRAREGLAETDRAIEAMDASGNLLAYPMCLGIKSLLSAEVGAIDEARGFVDEAITIVERTDERLWESALHCIRGDLFLRGHHRDENAARAAYEHAIAIAQSREARSDELRASLHLAQLLVHRGARVEAYSRLAPVFGWFTEGSETPDLVDARRLLDGLSE